MAGERDLARELAREFAGKDDSQGWFEALYTQAAGDSSVIPWADLAPNPNLTLWCERESLPAPGTRVLVTGCGLGDDAVYLASLGADVTAIDLSLAAIDWCKRRFSDSPVRFLAADLTTFTGSFDLTVEIYTLQAMPADIRSRAMASLIRLAPQTLVICRGRDATDPLTELPYPLTRDELAPLGEELSFEDFDDPSEPGKRRFRALFRSPSL